MDRPFLEISRVSVRFGAAAPLVLNGIGLGIRQGEYVAVIGHSGCGKSTLLNIVAGLLRATDGGVILEGKEVTDPGPDRAVVFQNHSLLPWLTCYENVRLAVDRTVGRGMTKAERHDWTMRNLALVRMEGHAAKRPHEISGGMKQRIGIARALAMRPKVLLLTNLRRAGCADARASAGQVMAIHASLGTTVMMITLT